MKKILGALRRAVTDFKMIEDGDKIAVGVSGGKDSLVLFESLYRYSKFSPEKFSLIAVNVNMGFKETKEEEMQALRAYFEEKGVPFFEEKTDIAEIIFNVRKETNPCSLCSKLRRGALCSIAHREGANKVALGHHADDVLETFLLSLTFEGRLSTLAPTSYLSRTETTVIRPLLYADEKDIRGVARRYELPVVFNPCPADKHTKREYMKKLVEDLRADIPDIRKNMINAIEHPERYNLWEKASEEE